MTSAVTTAPAELVRRKPPAPVRRKRFLVTVADHSLLIAGAIIFLAPFVFMVMTAFMTNGQVLSPNLWPRPFRFENFVDIFREAPLWRYALNTFIYGSLATVSCWRPAFRSRTRWPSSAGAAGRLRSSSS
jgi:multiple sugar transport system permease protein